LRAAPLVLGGNVFGWTADEATSHSILDRFVDSGFDLVDTANVYSTWVPGHKGGESETIIGNWLAKGGRRERVLVATKVGMEIGGEKGLERSLIERHVEDSLRRLRTDRIDLYQTHIDDPGTPVDETMEALGRLVKSGKVRAIGASQYKPDRLRASLEASKRLGIPRYDTLQPEYNLYDRDKYDGPLRDLAMREGLGVITYYGLASGFLSGKYRTPDDLKKSARGAGIGKRYMNPRGMRILAALDTVAARHDAQPAEVALAWLIQRPGVTAPIASATSLDQLASLMRATELQLSAEDVSTLEAASG